MNRQGTRTEGPGQQMAMKQGDPYDFMGSRPRDTGTDVTRQLREAENVLSSYSHAVDFLAEALQNATDAIDARRIEEPDCPARIEIRFDVASRSFSVADTGTGMSYSEAQEVLTPNVTLKAGLLKRVKTTLSRGEKGVGLSFLALGSNRLVVTTCDGEARTEVIVEGGNRWVQSEGASPKPQAVPARGPTDRYLDSTRYTIVSVSELDPDQFDEDLFATSLPRLIWDLRTRTAVGNTAPVFGREPANDIEVGLTYVDADSRATPRQLVPYAYATPDELLAADSRKSLLVEYSRIESLPTERMAASTRGKAVRYQGHHVSASGHDIDVYAFVMDGNSMNRHIRAGTDGGGFVPEWQGFWVATRDMPTGIDFVPDRIQPRTYHRRIFALFQDDSIKLDLGRKTLAGRTRRMFKDAAEAVWFADLRLVVPLVAAAGSEDGLEAALRAAVRRAQRLPQLDADVPYLKEPVKRQGVMALFHELLGARSRLPELRTLRSAVFTDDDALMYVGQPNGKDPLHVLFTQNAKELIADLEDDPKAASATLAVLWDLELDQLTDRRIEARPTTPANDGATHELILGGIGNRQTMRCIVLSSLLRAQSGS